MSGDAELFDTDVVSAALVKAEKKSGRPRFEAGLHPRNKAIARLVASGVNYTKVAKLMGTSPSAISRLMKAPLMKAEVGRLQGNLDEAIVVAQQRMLTLLDRSVDVIEENLGNPDEGISPMSPDRDAMTRDAWKVYDTVLGKPGKSGGGVNVNLQINQQNIMADLNGKSDEELAKGAMDIIKASKKEER